MDNTKASNVNESVNQPDGSVETSVSEQGFPQPFLDCSKEVPQYHPCKLRKIP